MKNLIAAISKRIRRNATIRELSSLSDRSLEDIGLTRGMIKQHVSKL